MARSRGGRLWLLPATCVVIVAAALLPRPGHPEHPHAVMQDWETAAGGRQSFEVATIKLADPRQQIQPNISLNDENEAIPPGGHFLARGTLQQFIEFAYKMAPTREQERAVAASLPKWATAQIFVIEAKAAAAGATKDQMRLMTQSLLANRFDLRVHFKIGIEPALAMVLVKRGEPGPRLRPHAEGLSCDAKWTAPTDRFSQSVAPGEFLPSCGWTGLLMGPHHTYLVGGRDFTLAQIADHIPMWQDFGRPVVDQTGLSGTYDFSLYSTPDVLDSAGPADDAQFATGAPTFTEALKEQLGVKLVPTKTEIRTLVIDHVEQPTPN